MYQEKSGNVGEKPASASLAAKKYLDIDSDSSN
jgi:hypothetical protein